MSLLMPSHKTGYSGITIPSAAEALSRVQESVDSGAETSGVEDSSANIKPSTPIPPNQPSEPMSQPASQIRSETNQQMESRNVFQGNFRIPPSVVAEQPQMVISKKEETISMDNPLVSSNPSGITFNISGNNAQISINQSQNGVSESSVSVEEKGLSMQSILHATDIASLDVIQEQLLYMQKILDAKRTILEAHEAVKSGLFK